MDGSQEVDIMHAEVDVEVDAAADVADVAEARLTQRDQRRNPSWISANTWIKRFESSIVVDEKLWEP